jgi:hypothetical protein
VAEDFAEVFILYCSGSTPLTGLRSLKTRAASAMACTLSRKEMLLTSRLRYRHLLLRHVCCFAYLAIFVILIVPSLKIHSGPIDTSKMPPELPPTAPSLGQTRDDSSETRSSEDGTTSGSNVSGDYCAMAIGHAT